MCVFSFVFLHFAFVVFGNDTVVGDPLFSIPMQLSPEGVALLEAQQPSFRRGGSRIPHLCFQIHGEPDTHFNFLSDACTSVNARYSAVQSEYEVGINVITRIGVSAVDALEQCVYIEVGVDNGCMPTVRSSDMDAVTTPRFNARGVLVAKRRNYVRISVPNCGRQRLVMYISCESQADSDLGVPMLRFDITRGINLSPTSHGLLGVLIGAK